MLMLLHEDTVTLELDTWRLVVLLAVLTMREIRVSCTNTQADTVVV